VELLLVVHREREEVLARLRALGERDGGQHHRFAVGDQDSAVGLTGHAAGFERKGAPPPLDGLAFDVEHFGFFLITRAYSRRGRTGDRSSEILSSLRRL